MSSQFPCKQHVWSLVAELAAHRALPLGGIVCSRLRGGLVAFLRVQRIGHMAHLLTILQLAKHAGVGAPLADGPSTHLGLQ